jgi:formylglycine-generating enzyme required for sulfatase activity
MKKSITISVVAVLLVSVLLALPTSSMAQNAKPWTKPGTEAGDEIVGPDGGTYVWVPPGEFMMGSDEERDNAKPLHKKRITQGFWLSKCEVSNEQYARFRNANGKNEDHEGHRLYWDTWGAAAIQREADTYELEAGREHHPAVDVSWYGAKAYCDFYGLRLPTEAEWEYAARGPRGFTYPWGNEWDERKCLWGVESKSVLDFANVGSFAVGRSWCGARNMAGNASEWCAEVFIRGASLYHDDGAYHCRSAYRAKYRPSPRDMFHSLGFRPAVTYDVQLSEPNVESLRAEDVVIKPGMRTTIVRGDFGRLNQIKDPETGTTTSLVNMPDGRVKMVEKDSDGNIINEVEYSKEDSEEILEGAEKITITKLPDGNIGVIKCDKDGKWTGFQSLPAKEKLVSASAYDPDTGITTTSKKNPDGSCTVTKSDEDGNITHEVTIPPSGSRATYVEAYDPKTGETTTVRRNPDGSCTVVKTDKQGNVISEEVKAPRDQELAFAKLYDPETKITTTVRKNPDGFITVTRSQNWKDKDGTKHTLEVDSDGNQTKILAHPDGIKTTTRWDAKGGETKVLTAKDGSEITIERTSDGHAIETTTRPDGTTTVVKRDHTGKVLETVKRDPSGKTVTTDSRGVVTKTQATKDSKTEMEIADKQLKEEQLEREKEIMRKRKEADQKLAELQKEYLKADNRGDKAEAMRIKEKMDDYAAKTQHLFDATEAEKKKEAEEDKHRAELARAKKEKEKEEERIRAEIASAEKELEEREKEIMRKREEANAKLRAFEDEYREAYYNRDDRLEANRIKERMNDYIEKTSHWFDATETEKKREELEDKRREADARIRRLQEDYFKASKFSYNPFKPILVPDKAKRARIKKRIDEVAEETQHLFDATEAETKKEAEEDKLRYELAKEIRHQAHGIAKSELAEKEVWQDTWDKWSDKELVDLEVGTIDVKDLSDGARFQDLTGKQRRAMLRYWADASARKQIILEKLADKKTTGEQRKILHNMLKRAEDEEQSAEEFIGDIDKITVLGYAGDAVIMATGGKAAQKIFRGGKILLRGGAKAGAETAEGVGRGAAKATRRVVGDKAADATVAAAKTVVGKGKAVSKRISDAISEARRVAGGRKGDCYDASLSLRLTFGDDAVIIPWGAGGRPGYNIAHKYVRLGDTILDPTAAQYIKPGMLSKTQVEKAGLADAVECGVFTAEQHRAFRALVTAAAQ